MKLRRFFSMATKQASESHQFYAEQKEPITIQEYLNKYRDIKINSYKDVKFPYNFKGMPDFLPISKELDNMILRKDNQEEYDEFLKSLNKRMVWYLKALASNKDEEFPFIEINFLLKVKQSLEVLKNNGYKVHFKEDIEGFSSKKKEISIFETTHIIGLNQNRFFNQNIEDYEINRDLEDKGILHFSLNELDTEEMEKDEILDYKALREVDNQMILRIHVKNCNKYIVQIEDPNGNIVSEKPESYIHTAVFENQLRLPPKFSRLKTTYLEWLKLYRIQQEWKLVDFDRFLQGNRLLYSENDNIEIFKI